MTVSPIRPPRVRGALSLNLLRGASVLAVACGLAASPAAAQLARLRGAVPSMPSAAVATGAIPARSVNMREALARATSVRARAEEMRAYVTSARSAALTAARANPTDGLSANGLNPILAIRQAIAASQAGDQAAAQAALTSASAAKDATGLATWQGAGIPVQTTDAGKTNVTITQTEARALLSWNRMDVGANTTLQFDQKLGGAPQSGWSVVNRVVASADPTTILGSIKADGQVFILNRNGVIFGKGAQVNLQALVASTLEIGEYGSVVRTETRRLLNGAGTTSVNVFDAFSLAQRNNAYLQNGAFALPTRDATSVSLLLSPLFDPGIHYADGIPTLGPVEGVTVGSAPFEGSVFVDQGASIASAIGGFVMLAGPRVENAGTISANNGQVSLQGGRYITAASSSGASNSVDPFVRGYILRTSGRDDPNGNLPSTPDDGVVVNSGLIESRRGYLSLGAGLFGEVTNSGLLNATTSVSRNAKVALTAGRVILTGASVAAQAGGIVVLPDIDGETIPQGTAASPPSFKTSQIEIGARARNAANTGDSFGLFVPSVVNLGENSLILAPSANVVIGRDPSVAVDLTRPYSNPSSVDIAAGATVDVSGVKDVQLAASRNSLEITPVKRNELRDTPNYREVSLNGDFTLNGTTLYVDPRVSGVREDGVAWIGSPLLEAGSLASQISVTAAELMTTGGNISLAVNPIKGAATPDGAPGIRIAEGAVFDFSGGWVNYAAGLVRTSRLITSDGRIVDLAVADPNDDFVAVADGYTEAQPRFGLVDRFSNAALQGGRFEQSYDEGRDAGSLSIAAASIATDATYFGNAFAGARQAVQGVRPSQPSALTGDGRVLQATAQQLPAGGLLRIGPFIGDARRNATLAYGGDIVVTHGIDAIAPGATVLDDRSLSLAGLSALSLQSSGAVSFAEDSVLSLAPGGVLSIDAGRTIRFDGDVAVPAGRIVARTYENAIGSAFRTDDDMAALYALGSALPRPYDIDVTGSLSTAGLWANDYAGDGVARGGAWRNGGSISLTVAPKVFVAIGTRETTAEDAADLSGSIDIAPEARIELSAGGYVAPDRSLRLDGRGGDLTLINETTYASLVPTVVQTADNGVGTSSEPISGSNQSVDFTPVDPINGSEAIVPSLVPSIRRAVVTLDPSSIRAFGFSTGGRFTLVAPDISLGSDQREGASHVGLDFVKRTGFGAIDLTTLRARVVPGLFSNGRAGNSSFFETTSFVIKSGETLDLNQRLLPAFLDPATTQDLVALATGADVAALLTPAVPTALFDQRAIDLTLGGLTELVVEQGGSIIGAPGATITVPKLLNAGTITLQGGHIIQRDFLPSVLIDKGLGVRDLSAFFGTPDANGRYDENASNAAGILTPSGERLATVREILTNTLLDQRVYLLGTLDAPEGIRLASGSTTDLSGVALYDPRASFFRGRQLAQGRILQGGSIETSARLISTGADQSRRFFSDASFDIIGRNNDFSDTPLRPLVGSVGARTFSAGGGATLDLSGASGAFDQLATSTNYTGVLQWSSGGRLSIFGSGGSLESASIDARGGAAAAAGGTLEWLRPTIGATASGGRLGADAVAAAGFANIVAYGGATFDGLVDLTLAESFRVVSAPSLIGAAIDPSQNVVISATPGANAVVHAPYIRLASGLSTLPPIDAGVGSGTLTLDSAGSIDVVGSVYFGRGLGDVSLVAAHDVRLTGVYDRIGDTGGSPFLNGQLVANGNLRFDAGRVYATTGTGNLQRVLEDRLRGGNASTDIRPYAIIALGQSSVRFDGSHVDATTPLSAGSYLSIQASNIVQNGFVAAPLGRIDFGSLTPGVLQGQIGYSATQTLSFGAGGITSVSAAGAAIPYGSTTDLTEYYFAPTNTLPLTALPSGELHFAAGNIDVAGATVTAPAGAVVDGRGGGSVFGYEFVSGTGGSRDLLDRINRDAFSSNAYDSSTGQGLQFSDGRQVYAIIPADQARTLAPFDPVYSADYRAGSGDLYGSQAGLSVVLDGGGGVPAGEYLLLPAHYALLPGVTAYRVVENTTLGAPAPGASQTLLDGSTIVGGTFAIAGTSIADGQRRSFTVQSRETFGRYSQLATTDGATTIVKQASDAGRLPSSIPADAARVVISPLNTLRASGAFLATPATGGRGSRFDILAKNITVSDGEREANGTNGLVIADTTLNALGANSLVLGAERRENIDGTTTLNILAQGIAIEGGASLAVPELLLAVGARDATAGENPTIDIADGATLVATGTLQDTRTTDYIVVSGDPDNQSPYARTGIGSVLRLANGTERLIDRQGDVAARNSLRPARLHIGAATISGDALALDTSRNLAIDPAASITTRFASLSGDAVAFGQPFIRQDALDAFSEAERLTLRSRDTIGFSRGSYDFNDLVIDAPGLRLAAFGPGLESQSIVTINAARTTLRNSALDLGGCTGAASRQCGHADNLLTLNATEIAFGKGALRTYGFDGAVTLTASNGVYAEGPGGFDTGATDLSITTPFVIDRAAAADPRAQALRSDLSLRTSGAFTLTARALPPGSTAPQPTGNRAPSARILIGGVDAPVASATIDGVALTATAGVIAVEARGDVIVGGAASFATPGYTRTFGDALDSVTVSASGGRVGLSSLSGNIVLPASATIITDNGTGNAGGLALLASNGTIDFGAALNPGLTGVRGGSFAFDAGKSAFDLAGFVTAYGTQFGGDIDVRSGVGDLVLSAGQTMRSTGFKLTADGGQVTVGGTIDTSGVSVAGLDTTAARDARVAGGDIGLYGRDGVTLAATALLDTHTTGYAADDTRPASAGDVSIGIESATAAITIAPGARIDAGARRTGNRLIAQTVKDPVTLTNTTVYRFAEADQGGVVSLRAPVIGANENIVDIRLGGSIEGARSTEVEGFKRYDLDAIVASGMVSGLALTKIKDPNSEDILLDFAQVGDNFLTENFVAADGMKSVVNFVQGFSLSAADGSDLGSFRLRPGIELASTRTIDFLTNWNLGAGVVDQDRAAIDGLLVPVDRLGYHNDAGFGEPDAGTPYYQVVAGREGDLLENYTNMLYRVGGKASGEAPVVGVRSRRSVDLFASITDGFFTFRDRSDPNYINYQLGGGDRTYRPALVVGCGLVTSNDCSGVVSFTDVALGNASADASNRITISTVNAVVGNDVFPTAPAPYSANANSAAALPGVNINGEFSGDAIGNADLFPLIAGGTQAIKSSSIRLIGGADATLSADPLHVDRATRAKVFVEGENSYTISATKGYASFAGGLQLRLRPELDRSDPLYVTDPANFISGDAGQGFDSSVAPDYYTLLTWGAGQGEQQATTRARAREFFDANFPGAIYQGGRNPDAYTGVAAPLSVVLQFLSSYGNEYAGKVVNGTFGGVTPATPGVTVLTNGRTVYYGNVVRTGDGAISLAAAGDVDLRRTAAPVYRTISNGAAPSSETFVVGGSAVYTAGQRALLGAISASDANGNAFSYSGAENVLSLDDADYLPSNRRRYFNSPVLADDGGDVVIAAGGAVLGRRDLQGDLALASGSDFLRSPFPIPLSPGVRTPETTFVPSGFVGGEADRWRVAASGQSSRSAIVPQLFGSGVGALAGGDIRLSSGGSISDVEVSIASSSITANPRLTDAPEVSGVRTGASDAAPPTLITLGSGSARVVSRGDVLGGGINIATGRALVEVEGNLVQGAQTGRSTTFGAASLSYPSDYRILLNDARIGVDVGGSLRVGGIGSGGQSGLYSPLASVDLRAAGDAFVTSTRRDVSFPSTQDGRAVFDQVLPGSFGITSLFGDAGIAQVPVIADFNIMAPSSEGSLNLLAGGSIDRVSIAMSDRDPSLFGGAFAVPGAPVIGTDPVFPDTSDATLRFYHNENITHRGDTTPSRIFAGGSITTSTFLLAEQARIGAGLDIVDLFLVGQNANAGDVTRVAAGRDIVGTVTSDSIRSVTPGGDVNFTFTGVPFVNGLNISVGGPGALSVEAGRNLGPFASSGTTTDRREFAGGIRTVGNDYNPWLDAKGADLFTLFGTSKGVDYDGFQATYLDPTNAGQLDGDLFFQQSDAFGNLRPDRGKPVYAPILARWLRDNRPETFASVFGATSFADDTALADAAYGRFGDLYASFATLDPFVRRDFLVKSIYFNELQQTSVPTGPSYLQYIRGYRAVEALFPARFGYTENLAPYTTDPATVNVDHPLGVPTRAIVDGQPVPATRVVTGRADLRLATIGTSRGGDVTILSPGGDFIAGSVVRTTEQLNRRTTTLPALPAGVLDRAGSEITALPLGFEGVITQRGGAIRSFTDGDFRLNQSRLFTLAGGDIIMWSSNGDLNAGQGPKSASNFPPVTLRFNPDGLSEVNSAGSVSGAGIGAFQRTPDDPLANISLIAPVGLVDAGDAGVRASGSIFVAAARVANADNFKAGGTISGVPTGGVSAAPAAPNSAASSVLANVARVNNAGQLGDKLSLITVDIEGYIGKQDPCDDPSNTDPECKVR